MMIGLMLVMSKMEKNTLSAATKNGCAGGVLVINRSFVLFLDVMRSGQCRWHLLYRRYIQVYSCKGGE